jgi:hypothetical protein
MGAQPGVQRLARRCPRRKNRKEAQKHEKTTKTLGYIKESFISE